MLEIAVSVTQTQTALLRRYSHIEVFIEEFETLCITYRCKRVPCSSFMLQLACFPKALYCKCEKETKQEKGCDGFN